MRMAILALMGASVFGSGARATETDGLLGTWLTENGDSKIRISACGRSYCGTVVWAKSNILDSHNPDPSLRKRSVVGMPLTRDMRPSGAGSWAGSIYNPENGKTYEITMLSKGSDKLEVEGCVLGVLCGSDLWSRLLEETANADSAARPSH